MSVPFFGHQLSSGLEKKLRLHVYIPTEDIHHKGQSSEEGRQAAACVTDVWQYFPVDSWYVFSDLHEQFNSGYNTE